MLSEFGNSQSIHSLTLVNTRLYSTLCLSFYCDFRLFNTNPLNAKYCLLETEKDSSLKLRINFALLHVHQVFETDIVATEFAEIAAKM